MRIDWRVWRWVGLISIVLAPGCSGGGGGGGNGPPGDGPNNPPVINQASLTPTNVDFSGQPPVTISANVTDNDLNSVEVTATVRRQSDGASFSVSNFARTGNTFAGTFNTPPNAGTTTQTYQVTVTASDGVNPAAVVTATQRITATPPTPAPPVPFP